MMRQNGPGDRARRLRRMLQVSAAAGGVRNPARVSDSQSGVQSFRGSENLPDNTSCYREQFATSLSFPSDILTRSLGGVHK
jgi:hypothetical protein